SKSMAMNYKPLIIDFYGTTEETSEIAASAEEESATCNCAHIDRTRNRGRRSIFLCTFASGEDRCGSRARACGSCRDHRARTKFRKQCGARSAGENHVPDTTIF